MMTHKRVYRLVPGITLGLAATLMLNGCSESASLSLETENIMQSGAVPVRVTPVERLQQDEVLRFAGVARARQRASLSFQVGGTLESRDVEIGQLVSPGQVVARLYNPQLGPATEAARARLEQLQNDAEQAERDLERMEQLYERGVLAIQNLEQQRSLLQGTASAIGNARALLSQTEQLNRESELRAPFAGRIEAVLLEPGEFAQPGQAVMRMSAEDGLEVEVRVPPHMLEGLAPGQSVSVWPSLGDRELKGVITETGESGSSNSALYPLIVGLEDSGLRSGEAVEVGIPFQSDSQLSIPVNAVMRSASGLSVFRVNNDQVQRVLVDIDQITGDRAIIVQSDGRASLSEGEHIVYAGLTRLAEGDRVEILP